MARKKVYVTRKFPGKGLSMLFRRYDIVVNERETPPSRAEILRNSRGAHGIVCMLSDCIDKEVMDAAGDSLRVISSYSTGFEHVDVKEATSRGIYVMYTADILAEATADLTFGLLLACARNIPRGDVLVRQGKWKVGWSPDLLLGTEVHGSTLGIVGLGRIGSAVAKRAKGFGMKVLYNNRKRDLAKEVELGVEYADFDDLLSRSDFVCLHTSLNDMSRNIIDKRALSKMKRSAYLINTSRGQVVNERDLARALKNGLIAGAGLDVYEREPLSRSSPLARLSKVVLLPHIGSATAQTRSKMGEVAAGNVIDVLEGTAPGSAYLVNPEVATYPHG